MLTEVPEFLEENVVGLEQALKDKPVHMLFQVVHRLLVSKNMLHKKLESVNQCQNVANLEQFDSACRKTSQNGDDRWQPYGLEVAHALFTACIYPSGGCQVVYPNGSSKESNRISECSSPARDESPQTPMAAAGCSSSAIEGKEWTLVIDADDTENNPVFEPTPPGEVTSFSSPERNVSCSRTEGFKETEPQNCGDRSQSTGNIAGMRKSTERIQKFSSQNGISDGKPKECARKFQPNTAWKRGSMLVKSVTVPQCKTSQALEECMDLDDKQHSELAALLAANETENISEQNSNNAWQQGVSRSNSRAQGMPMEAWARSSVDSLASIGSGTDEDRSSTNRLRAIAVNSKSALKDAIIGAGNAIRPKKAARRQRNKLGSIVNLEFKAGSLRRNMVNDQASDLSTSAMHDKKKQTNFSGLIETIVHQVRLRSQIEHDKSENPPVWWQMHPNREARQLWNIVMTVMLGYTMVALPLRICFTQMGFERPSTGWVVELVVNLFFALDMGVNCITGVYIKRDDFHEKVEEQLTVEHSKASVSSMGFVDMVSQHRSASKLTFDTKKIVCYYLKGWFTVDFVSVVPFDVILDYALSGGGGDFAHAPRLLKLLRLIRLVKLLRLYRLRTVIVQMQKLFPAAMLEMMKLSMAVGVLAHYVACGFYYVAVLTDEDGSGSWLEKYHDTDSAVKEETVGSLYLSSMYWGFTTVTSVGYGDIVPVTHAEKLYALFVMYCGVVMMSGITGKLTAVLSQLGAQEAITRIQLESVETYCKYRDLPHHLTKSVTEYFEMRIAAKAACDEQAILKGLSPALKAQVVCHSFQNIIKAVPFFAGCSTLFLSAVLCCMELVMYAPADIIIQKGQRELAMFVLAKGRAAVIDSYGRVIKELGNGDFFGEIGLFFGVRRTATVCSITFSDIFILAQEEFAKVQAMYPDMKELIQHQAENMFSQSVKCYLCNQTGHVALQCTVSRLGQISKGEEAILELENHISAHEMQMEQERIANQKCIFKKAKGFIKKRVSSKKQRDSESQETIYLTEEMLVQPSAKSLKKSTRLSKISVSTDETPKSLSKVKSEEIDSVVAQVSEHQSHCDQHSIIHTIT